MFNRLHTLAPHERKITVSTLITGIRFLLTPCVVGAMIAQRWGLACLLFFVAAVTDVLDGALARWRNEQTFLGACLDPIADKVLILSVFCTLAFVQSPLFAIPIWFVCTILLKELILILGAVALYGVYGSLEIKPTIIGKSTMLMQVLFILWLFACYFFHWLPIKTYYTMLGALLIFSVAALCDYAYIGLKNTLFKSV